MEGGSAVVGFPFKAPLSPLVPAGGKRAMVILPMRDQKKWWLTPTQEDFADPCLPPKARPWIHPAIHLARQRPPPKRKLSIHLMDEWEALMLELATNAEEKDTTLSPCN